VPRTLTKKEIGYLDELIRRNYDATEKSRKPLKLPMTVNERQIRFRLRKKVNVMVRDLLKIDYAGICDVSEIYDVFFDAVAVHLKDEYMNDDEIKLKHQILYE